MKIILKSTLFLLSLILLAATARIEASSASPSAVVYVAPGGDDSNDCLSPTEACETIPGGIAKAATGETVQVATGVYIGTGQQVVLINKNISLSGGWDGDFNSQTGTSTVDGQNARHGIWVDNGILATTDRFTIENATPDGGAGILNYGTFTLTYSTVQNNPVGASSITAR